jgi:hypothetical protein
MVAQDVQLRQQGRLFAPPMHHVGLGFLRQERGTVHRLVMLAD